MNLTNLIIKSLLSIKNYKNIWSFSKSEINTLSFAFNLFLFTEVLVFFVLFWSWFHASIIPTIWIGNIWPTIGIIAPKWWGIGLYNTIILFTSSCYITWAELSLKLRSNKIESLTALILGVYASIHFLICQYIEFSRLPFTFRDSIYGTMFYSITGLHLLHVLIGTILLILTVIKVINIYSFNYKHY